MSRFELYVCAGKRGQVRKLLLGGVPVAAVLLASNVFAQDPGAEDYAKLVDRLSRLEAKIDTLEAEKEKLSQDMDWKTGRLEKVENRAASVAQPGVVPTYGDPSGNFKFKLRGVIDADAVVFNERKGGYNYNNGTAFRRARIGLEGDAYKDFKWRIEADFAANAVNLQDVYVQYAGIKPLTITLGQHKAPFGLESNNSDNYNTFLERGQFTNAFGTVGAERRIGLSVAYIKDNYTFTAGFFGDNESSSRSDTAVDESWGFNARGTWEAVNEPGRILHVGASAFYRGGLKDGTVKKAIRLSDRPNVRVDGGFLSDSGQITSVEDIHYAGAEAAGVYGPVSIVGEYGRLTADRTGALADPSFEGFYVYGSWFLTGESRSFKAGNFDRLVPFNNFDLKSGGLGAWELAVRYDYADFSETPVAARLGNKTNSTTAAVNWYLNPNLKLSFNWVRFNGANTPLDPVGANSAGDAFAVRAHLDW
jgi:phosphate-selective porin OprO/OprP